MTILYTALENIVATDLQRRWILAFGFGLVHGFAFSLALAETWQFAGNHHVTSLLAFNIGIELGQIAVLAVLVPALGYLFRHVVAERLGIVILSALVAHQAWHWTIDRGGEVLKFSPPRLDAAFLAGGVRALMAALVLGGVVWVASSHVRRWVRSRSYNADT